LYLKVDHIGVAVRSLEDAIRVYTEGLGLCATAVEDVPEQKTRVAVIPVGESRVELLEATGADSPVARFIARRGEGIHHFCLEVDDLAATMSRLKSAGIRMVDPEPRKGAGGHLVAFVHPSALGGVLLELSQSISSSE
jgi:methylmalonyl-CoA/ethylmalonyl-CoA epimerase